MFAQVHARGGIHSYRQRLDVLALAAFEEAPQVRARPAVRQDQRELVCVPARLRPP
jgi:hypothetical protein